jgi:primary-amine oxidase
LCLLFVVSAFAQSELAHPLDPLNEAEIAAAVATLRAENKVTENSRFYNLTLHEPPKSEVINFKPGTAFRREAFVGIYDRAANQTFEAVVDVRAKKVISWKEIKGVQPMMMGEDFELATSIANSDPNWQEALRKRGILDYENVQVDGWAPGWFGFEDEANIRMARGIPFYRGTGINGYSRPIEGLIAYIDLTNKRILKITDTAIVPVPKTNAELDEESNKPLRTAPKPLQIIQPEGASFEVRGNEVRWQNWRFRYAMHQREGLVLYTVGYEDQGKLRPILYRGSLSEMVVPYGDPSMGWFIRNAFDEGEYGIGANVAEMDKNDAPPNATILPAIMADEKGDPQSRDRAVALFERDGGILWKIM